MGSLSSIRFLAYATLAFGLAQLWTKWRRVARSVGNLPGLVTIFAPTTLASNLLPRIPLITKGRSREIETGYADFAVAGCDAFAHRSTWPRPDVMLYVADPGAIKEITTYRSRFPKPVEQYGVLAFYGNNIVASEGEEWKRYRKISAPAFSEVSLAICRVRSVAHIHPAKSNNKLVWDESVRILLDMIENVWNRASSVSIDHVLEVTLPITLFIIAAAGFGRRMSFTEELTVPPGFTMTFKDALRVVSEGVLIKLAVPKRALGLTKRFREVDIAFEQLQKHMLHMIRSRKQSPGEDGGHDLFSSLLGAAFNDADDEPTLADDELMGNIFVFLLAGHETTAHSLAFCFALLALYPEKQDRLFEHIKSVMSDLDHFPQYQDMARFTYSMAVFNETLRIRPPVTVIPKYSEEDTTLNVKDAEGRTRTIPVPKGTAINIHTPGLHNNPHYWESPSEFIPERFLGNYPKDAFLPFRPRACIGRRFAETEAVAILTILMSQYRVHVKEDPKYAAETHAETHARLLRSVNGLTTTPIDIPLTFERRM
ncbi:unnamed protein product [Peniophora sp. CBMAI 1063]|nr:unnamed protein product [Peniophora sp. CBMAI 1063]